MVIAWALRNTTASALRNLVSGCTAAQIDVETLRDLLAQRTRVQKLADAWLVADEQQQLQHAGWAEHQAFGCGVQTIDDHVRSSSRRG